MKERTGNCIWHILTGEYPPTGGGVSDYTAQIAAALVDSGDTVHVWTGSESGQAEIGARVETHRCPRAWTPAGLIRTSRMLSHWTPPRRLLVQYTPSNFGCRSANLFFAVWIWWRARYCRDRVAVMFHEFGQPFTPLWKRANIVACFHRMMAFFLIRASGVIWVSIPRIGGLVRRCQSPSAQPPLWLPVPSNIPVCPMTCEERIKLRARLAGTNRWVIGHFGTYTAQTAGALAAILPAVLEAIPEACLKLFGRQSREFALQLSETYPRFHGRVEGLGELTSDEVSQSLQTCDLMIQPYPDGVSSRRTSIMAGLIHGLPIITNAGPASEPIWKESGAVVLMCPDAQPEAYAATARRMLLRSDILRDLYTAATTLYADRFALLHVVSALRSSTNKF